MIKKLFLLIGFIFCVICLSAQEYTYVIGKITDLKSKESIENAHVKIHQRNIIVKSSSSGEFKIKFPKKKRNILVFSHTSYQTLYYPINSEKDTIHLVIDLKQKTESLPEFVYSEKPKAVFKSTKISIADYEFYEDKFLFLVYGKRLNKDSELYLVDENENIISRHFVPGEPVELYSDYMGNVNLICKNSIYRVGVNKGKISIYELPLDDFNQLIKPIVDTLGGTILFSDFLEQFPRFRYYAFNPEDTSVTIIKELVNKDMDWRYNFEYEFLSNADKQFAKRMAKRIKGYDHYDVAAHMTGFANSFLYEEVYAPMFIINDTINIFDHDESLIWKFINDTVQVDSIEFNYHKPKKKNTWKKELIMDEVTGNIYGVFLKNGFYYLKQINSSNGEIVAEKKLYYQYVEKLKVKDGFIYYTYKPSRSLTKKFLYKELF